MGPECPCEGDACTIFTDDFTTDQLATAYDTRSGSFSVSGGELSTSTATGALLVANTAGTSGVGRVTVNVKTTSLSNVVRLIGAYVDDSNYLFAELTYGGFFSTLKLYKRVAGVNTQLGYDCPVSAATNTYLTMSLCWTGLTATARAGSGGTSNNTYGLYSGTGNKVGVGADVASGSVTFDELAFTNDFENDNTCEGCVNTCGSCNNDSNSMMDHVVLVLSNIRNGTDASTALNGTYILDIVDIIGTNQGDTTCKWQYVFPTAVAGVKYLDLFLDVATPQQTLFLFRSDESTSEATYFGNSPSHCRVTSQGMTQPGTSSGPTGYEASSADWSWPFVTP